MLALADRLFVHDMRHREYHLGTSWGVGMGILVHTIHKATPTQGLHEARSGDRSGCVSHPQQEETMSFPYRRERRALDSRAWPDHGL